MTARETGRGRGQEAEPSGIEEVKQEAITDFKAALDDPKSAAILLPALLEEANSHANTPAQRALFRKLYMDVVHLQDLRYREGKSQ